MGRTGLWLGTWHPMLLVLGTLWFSECGQLGGMGSLADMSQTSWEWLACILRIGTSLSIKAYLPLGLTIVGSCHIVFSKGRFDNWQEKVLACFKMFMSCPVLNVFKLVAPKCYLSVLLTDLPSTSLINFLTLFFFLNLGHHYFGPFEMDLTCLSLELLEGRETIGAGEVALG